MHTNHDNPGSLNHRLYHHFNNQLVNCLQKLRRQSRVQPHWLSRNGDRHSGLSPIADAVVTNDLCQGWWLAISDQYALLSVGAGSDSGGYVCKVYFPSLRHQFRHPFDHNSSGHSIGKNHVNAQSGPVNSWSALRIYKLIQRISFGYLCGESTARMVSPGLSSRLLTR